LLPLEGRTVIDWTLDALSGVPEIAEVVVALSHVTPSSVGDTLVERPEGIPRSFITARSWLEAVESALESATPSRRVLLQPANRPLLPAACLRAVMEAGTERPVTVAAVPVKNTYKRVVEGRVVETIPRQNLFLLQGPWLFDRATLDDAVGQARHFQWSIADELSLCQRMQLPIHLVEGDHGNVPITGEADLWLMERLWH
jgi:2-C-methyl-D-erythritol 4-phosphate cytidylyltransferase